MFERQSGTSRIGDKDAMLSHVCDSERIRALSQHGIQFGTHWSSRGYV